MLVLFISCRQELYENSTLEIGQNQIKLEWLRKDQIRERNNLFQKVQSLNSPKDKSVNGKIYTDAENGFSVDTDLALMMTNENGEKTYTFKIERTEPNNSLENLVLKEAENEMFDAYIVKYDTILLNNSQSIPNNLLNNYITINSLGKKSSASIFSKVVSCFSSHQVSTYVQGIPCVNGHTNPANCDLKGDAAPIPGHWSSYFINTWYDCDDGSIPEGSFGTTPVGYGGSMNEYTLLYGLECAKLKNHLQKAKELIDDNIVKTQNDIMKANILNDSFEKAFYWGKNAQGQMKVSNIVDGGVGNTVMSISNSQFTPEAYAHNHNGTDGYTNFSSTDINQFHAYHQGFSTLNHNFVNGSDDSQYVMTIEDQFAFDDFVQQYPMSSIDVISPSNPNGTGDWKKNTDIYRDELYIYRYFLKQGKTDDQAMDLTLGYLIQKYNMGIMISKKGNDGKFHPIQVYAIPTIDTLTGMTIVTYEQLNLCNL